MISLKKLFAAAVLLPLAATVAQAGPKTVIPVEPAGNCPVSGTAAVSVASEHISYGLPLGSTLALTPSIDLGIALYEDPAACISKVSLDLGFQTTSWNKTKGHNARMTNVGYGEPEIGWAGKGNGWRTRELQYTIGLSAVSGPFTLSAAYLYLERPSFVTWQPASPGGITDWPKSDSLVFTLAYDDSSLLGAFALRPYVSYLTELQGSIANTRTGGKSHHGNYFELGVQPSLPRLSWLEVSFPVKLGLGSGNFYGSQYQEGSPNYKANWHYGFFSAGVQVGVPLTFIPAAWGEWKLTAGGTYYNLNQNITNRRMYNVKRDRYVANGGLSVSF